MYEAWQFLRLSRRCPHFVDDFFELHRWGRVLSISLVFEEAARSVSINADLSVPHEPWRVAAIHDRETI